MKKLLVIAAALAMALALTACGLEANLSPEAELSFQNDENGFRVVATNGAGGTTYGDITIKEGYGLCVNHTVNRGAFQVKATDEQGKVVFDKEVTDNIADLVPATGKLELEVTAKDADGTVDIIAYDEAAQAQADATLDDSIKDAIAKK